VGEVRIAGRLGRVEIDSDCPRSFADLRQFSVEGDLVSVKRGHDLVECRTRLVRIAEPK